MKRRVTNPLVKLESVSSRETLDVQVWQFVDKMGHRFFPHWRDIRPAAANVIWLLFRETGTERKRNARAA